MPSSAESPSAHRNFILFLPVGGRAFGANRLGLRDDSAFPSSGRLSSPMGPWFPHLQTRAKNTHVAVSLDGLSESVYHMLGTVFGKSR